jgi:hypothetical protein
MVLASSLAQIGFERGKGMNLRIVGLFALVFGVITCAGDEDHARLMGGWESQTGTGSNRETWLLEAKGDALHVTYLQGEKKLAEFECDTDGKDCATKVAGHSAKVSLWYNGSKLVELETKGSEVVKRRFALAGAGEEMDLEIIPIASDCKAETLHFKRASTAPGK